MTTYIEYSRIFQQLPRFRFHDTKHKTIVVAQKKPTFLATFLLRSFIEGSKCFTGEVLEANG